MRKAAILLIGISLAGLAPLVAQETAAEPPPQTAPMLSVQTGFTYNSEGRRDPFKDLLGGRDLKEKSVLGENQIFIDDLVLFGIVKNQTVYTALIGPRDSPCFPRSATSSPTDMSCQSQRPKSSCGRPTSAGSPS
jgi:hypothetical protein